MLNNSPMPEERKQRIVARLIELRKQGSIAAIRCDAGQLRLQMTPDGPWVPKSWERAEVIAGLAQKTAHPRQLRGSEHKVYPSRIVEPQSQRRAEYLRQSGRTEP